MDSATATSTKWKRVFASPLLNDSHANNVERNQSMGCLNTQSAKKVTVPARLPAETEAVTTISLPRVKAVRVGSEKIPRIVTCRLSVLTHLLSQEELGHVHVFILWYIAVGCSYAHSLYVRSFPLRRAPSVEVQCGRWQQCERTRTDGRRNGRRRRS